MEGVYIIHTREFINANLPIYKLGRSNNLSNRVKQYPNGSNIMCIMHCSNSILCEKNLIELFIKIFIRKKNYGNEYFEGDIDEMIFTIFNYLYKDKFIKNIKLLKQIELLKTTEPLKTTKPLKTTEPLKQINKDTKIVEHKDRTCPSPNCGTIFKYPSGLKKHFELSHHCKKEQIDIDLYFFNIKKDNKNKNTCYKCNIVFKKNFLLIRHKKKCINI